jgi:hypothetical protein
MADQLTRADRRTVLLRLEALRAELADASTWLSMHGADKAAIFLECAERDVGAACWDLERVVRLRPEGWLSSQPAPRPFQS